MINKEMNDKSKTRLTEKPPTGAKPNEIGGVYFSSSIKIFDPNSNEVLVQKRGDD